MLKWEREQLKQKLLRRTIKKDGPLDTQCWEWVGARNEQEYGNVWWQGVCCKAHRLSYIAFVAPIPNGLFCLHHCDNPPCLRPNHLYLGTNKDNMDDRRRRGRSPHLVGELSACAVLTEREASEIKFLALEAQLTLRQIGGTYGVTHRLVRLIRDGLVWPHVEPREPPPQPIPPPIPGFVRRI